MITITLPISLLLLLTLASCQSNAGKERSDNGKWYRGM